MRNPAFLLSPSFPLTPRRYRSTNRSSIRACIQEDPLYLPTPQPHTPHIPFPKPNTLEGDSTQLEQPPPPPPPSPPPNDRDRRSDDDDDDLPQDVRQALSSGALPQERIPLYRSWLRNPFLAMLLSLPSFRTRALACPDFMFKLAAQELIGNGTALASEIAVRGGDIVHEMEYVASDLIVGTVVEAAFVWLLAPTLRGPDGGGGGALGKWLKSLPAHMFEPSVGRVYTLPMRVGSFVYAGLQYAMIGFVAGVVGTGITYALIEGRKRLDSSYVPERPLPDVLPNSIGWAAFMALSSNPRFQVVEGLELLARRTLSGDRAVNMGIVVLRLVNNYWGGVQFVQFFRYLGLHATGESEGAKHEEKKRKAVME